MPKQANKSTLGVPHNLLGRCYHMLSLITRPMLRRSVITSCVVGGILFTINHELRVLLHLWPATLWRQLGMSMVIPFIVSLTSAVLTRRELRAVEGPGRGSTPRG